jgi:hypothetical protein
MSTSAETLPSFQRPEDLERYARQYGIDRDRLRAARTSVSERQRIIEDLQRSGLNGQSERVGRHLQTYQQEFDRKETWLAKIPLIGKPLDWTWRQFWKRPVMYSLIGVGLFAGGLALYYSALGRWLLEHLPNYSGAVNRVGREAAIPATADMALNGQGVGAVTGATSPETLMPPTPPMYSPDAPPVVVDSGPPLPPPPISPDVLLSPRPTPPLVTPPPVDTPPVVTPPPAPRVITPPPPPRGRAGREAF